MHTKAALLMLTGMLLVSGVVGLIGYASRQQPRAIPINDLAQLIEHGQIASLEVSGNVGIATTRQQQTFSFRVEQPGGLPGLLQNFGVTSDQLGQVSYSISSPVQLGDVLSTAEALLPLLLIAGVVVFMVHRRGASGEAFNFGKARARVFDSDRPLTTFEDVAGVDEAKHELQEVVEFLQAPERFTALGARLPRGVLLVGPPGTGKTLLARAVAGEAGVPFFSISGSAFVEMFVGVGASRVRDLFDQAKRSAPSIIFVDEVDAVGRRRGSGLGGSNDEREQTLNQILVEMDGFDARTNVIVIAATNRPDVLDQALLRPGRFDRQVQVPTPDVRGREAVLRVHARGKPVDASVDLVGLAGATPGFSGADLANVLNEAAILAARRRSSTIDGDDVEEAIDRVLAGPAANSRLMSDAERRLTAYHEAGHAVVARFLDNHDPVHKITIVGRGRAGGYTRFLPSADRHYQTRSQFASSIASALGGHVAETVVFGEMSTGASNDLERATALARRMVTEFGMSERLGVVALGSNAESGEPKAYSEQTAQAIDAEVRRLTDEACAYARTLIVEHRLVLDRLVQALLQRETLQGQELERAFTGELPGSQLETPRAQPARRPARLPSARLLPGVAMSFEADPR